MIEQLSFFWVCKVHLLFHKNIPDQSFVIPFKQEAKCRIKKVLLSRIMDIILEKFEFVMSLLREPRYLLSDTLVAEQLKLTLKLQAYRLEQVLLHQSIDEAMDHTHGPAEHR